MLTPPPHIPFKLAQKLQAAVRPHQREYDDMLIADARRLLGRHDYKIPVLCDFVFHKNGNLKRVRIRQNLKRIAPSPREFAAAVTPLASPENETRQLLFSSLRWIAEDSARQFLKDERHRASSLTDENIEEYLLRISEYKYCERVRFGDVSLLMTRRILERERDLRGVESKHSRLRRLATEQCSDLHMELEEEREAAFAWRDKLTAVGRTPIWPYEYAGWAEDQRVVLAYRANVCQTACNS